MAVEEATSVAAESALAAQAKALASCASAERDRLSRQVVSLQQELLAASERVDKQRTRW